MTDSKEARDPRALLSIEEFNSLREVGKEDTQGDIPQGALGAPGCSGLYAQTAWYPAW
jgi:hypothetical protein